MSNLERDLLTKSPFKPPSCMTLKRSGKLDFNLHTKPTLIKMFYQNNVNHVVELASSA